MIEFLILGLMAHSVGDFALQSNWIAEKKSRHYTKWGEPNKVWKHVIVAHGLINAAMMYLFLGSILIAVLEAILHVIIDIIKCEGKTTINADQFLHFCCIVVYAVLLTWFL